MTDATDTSETNDDTLFDDNASDQTSKAEPKGEAEGTEAEAGETTATAKDDGKGDVQEQQGDKDAVTPTAKGKDEGKDAGKSGKMVPENRIKAALKNVTDERDALRAEVAKFQKTQAPDRTKDPDGHERHVRIEVSKAVMQKTHDDYDDKITHFHAMAKENPMLNQIVGDHEVPAQLAYDLATKDMEIRELEEVRTSGEWEEFQTWKADKAAAEETKTQEQETSAKLAVAATSKAGKVPNLNKTATATGGAGKAASASDNDDDLFAGHYSHG